MPDDLHAWVSLFFVAACAVGAVLPAVIPGSAAGSQIGINAALLAISVATFVAVRRMPQLATVWWLVPLVLVPAVSAVELWGVRMAPAMLLSASVILGLKWQPWPHWTRTDVSLAILAVVLVASGFLSTPPFLIKQGITQWVLAAVAGRLLVTSGRFRGDHFAVVGAILSVLAAIQVVTRFDISQAIPASASGELWVGLQYRGGFARAELGLGHSIALGAVLAICLAFALHLASRRQAIVLGGVIGAGILATQSRSAMIAGVIVVALTWWTNERTDRALKKRVMRFAIPIAVLGLPVFVYYFVLGGLNPYSEVTQGSRYRLKILANVQDADILGLARNAVEVASGRYSWNGAQSIDNTILYLALYAGWLVAIAYVLPMILVAVEARRRTWDAATIAVVAQAPLILTVAPITQYQSVLWLVVGAAAGVVAINVDGRSAPDDAPTPDRGIEQHDRSGR